MNQYPRETIEFQPVVVTVDWTPVTEHVQFSVVQHGRFDSSRPTMWTDPVVLGDQIGVMVQGMDPGLYDVWARVTSNPEVPVILCGTFQIT